VKPRGKAGQVEVDARRDIRALIDGRAAWQSRKWEGAMKLFAISSGRRAGRRAEAGFTLVEMLVVIAIIGLIMGLVGPRVLNSLGESKVKAAKLQIESFSSSLDLFYLDVGRYPTASEGLVALAQRPGNASIWNGPYLKTGSVPTDPWGHVYLYRAPAERGPYEIVSLGSDGQEGGTGTSADISSDGADAKRP
jgi:general secretion pathway protein G